MEKPNFWDNNHPLSKNYDQLVQELIPPSDNCNTLQGEFLRAANRIVYDWYNNGWGCNNWSGAVCFLKRFFSLLPNQPAQEKLDNFNRSLRWVYKFSHGEPAPVSDEAADEHCTIIVETVVQALLDNPTRILNTRDMFDFQEKHYEAPKTDWDR